MALTSQDIDRIAILARLDPSAEERLRLTAELNAFFQVVEQMRAVDTTGVEPLAHPGAAVHDVALRLCDDTAEPALDEAGRARFQRSAPAVERGLFLVPRVIE